MATPAASSSGVSAQQVAMGNSALWDSGTLTSAVVAVVVTEPIAGRFKKFQGTLYI